MKAAEKVEEKAIVEICPLCGSPLEKGYMAAKEIAWSQNKNIITFVGAEHIIGVWYIGIFNELKAVEAYRCRKCKLIIFSPPTRIE